MNSAENEDEPSKGRFSIKDVASVAAIAGALLVAVSSYNETKNAVSVIDNRLKWAEAGIAELRERIEKGNADNRDRYDKLIDRVSTMREEAAKGLYNGAAPRK